jgi:membrane protein DedA with SNARE-associated domain
MVDAVLLTQGFASYVLVFLMLLAGAVGLPMPEDIALITGGILVSSGQSNLLLMSLVCYTGIIAGDLIIYRIGWIAGPTILRKRWARRYFSVHRIRSLRGNLEKRTFLTIMVARHLFYLRTATFLFCGAVRVSFIRFIVADAIAALITTPLMLGIGYVCGEHYREILSTVNEVKELFGLAVILIAGYLLLRSRSSSRARHLSGQTSPR